MVGHENEAAAVNDPIYDTVFGDNGIAVAVRVDDLANDYEEQSQEAQKLYGNVMIR